MQELSVKAVRPIVVGTDEPPAVTFLPRDQFMAAVSAYVVKSMHLTAFRPLEKKGPRSDFYSDVIAWLRKVRLTGHINPSTVENPLKLLPENFSACIEARRQGEVCVNAG
jgi:hypothetical protein